jgi:hypothetical protein
MRAPWRLGILCCIVPCGIPTLVQVVPLLAIRHRTSVFFAFDF